MTENQKASEVSEIRTKVREHFGNFAAKFDPCSTQGCCGSSESDQSISISLYETPEVDALPEDVTGISAGCGDPVTLASLNPEETVLDLGSGGGIDCFLAAQKVGETGKVIGVDMTPEMLDKARENAREGGYENVEFRLGEIENLPAADNSIDIIISNCVINLSPDKKSVFDEAFRVLKPGGRLMVSDIVLLQELPDLIRDSIAAYVGCISGALLKAEYLDTITGAGFQDVQILDEAIFPIDCMANDPTAQAVIKKLNLPEEEIKDTANSVASIKVRGIKPE